MRAIVYDRAGDSGVLRLIEREAEQPGPGEVRVRIAVSGVNPTDWKARAGRDPLEPQVPNQDGAGVVDAVGPDAGVRVGDRVWVWDAAYRRPNGTAQELAIVPAAQVQPLPDNASFDLGASLGIPALTAHLALRADATEDAVPLSPGALAGRTVLVAGGAGAVGHAAIELAVWAGATVLTTVSSTEKAALARAAGAHHVIDYTALDVARVVLQHAPDGVDLVVEVNPNENADLDARILTPGGTVAAYASGDDPLELDLRRLMSANARWRFLLTYTAPAREKHAAVAGVQAALEAGALRIGDGAGLPLTRFPLEQTAEAHDAVEAGTTGKVLIDVADLG
ncbi:NADPH:quinone reductase [uncultured Amnibacterium sp.]|uniref:NADPH:quinone reductase n=1 Tax=uncultured Amnibacterium sp. TaxID=1631851 RepID=UPI0035C96983